MWVAWLSICKIGQSRLLNRTREFARSKRQRSTLSFSYNQRLKNAIPSGYDNYGFVCMLGVSLWELLSIQVLVVLLP